MRMTGFILGGICGIAAAVYVARKRPAVMSWMGGRVLDTALNKKFGQAGQTGKQAQAGNQGGGKAASGGNDKKAWQTIENLLQTDPKAKRETADIMASSAH